MKFLGTTLLAICPIFFGFLKSKNLKQNQIKIEKIIELINRIITEIRFAKTNTYKIFKNLSLEENFNCLEFLKYFKEKNNLKPFPKAFEESINSWDCSLKKDDLNQLKTKRKLKKFKQKKLNKKQQKKLLTKRMVKIRKKEKI